MAKRSVVPLAVRAVRLDNGRIKEQGEFELAQVLMEIGGLDEAEKIINSQKEYLFFTEDQNKKSLKTLLKCCGVNPEQFDIISYYGTSNAHPPRLALH